MTLRAECCYADCRYAECCGAIFNLVWIVLVSLKVFFLNNFQIALKYNLCHNNKNCFHDEPVHDVAAHLRGRRVESEVPVVVLKFNDVVYIGSLTAEWKDTTPREK